MLRPLLLALVAAALAAPAAHAASVGVQGDAIVLDAPGDVRVGWASPGRYDVKDGDDGARYEVEDPAGFITIMADVERPGAGCWRSDPLNPMFDDPSRSIMLLVCRASAAPRFEVRGGAGADEVTFEPAYAFAGETAVLLGGGNDTVVAKDAATERIDCGAGYDEAKADLGDGATGCEDGDFAVGVGGPASSGAKGIFERRGDVLVADLAGVPGNELHRVVLDADAVGDSVQLPLTSGASPRVGEGCALRNRLAGQPPAPTCAAAGVSRIEVRGPEVVRESFRLSMDLAGLRIPGDVRAGRGEALIDVADGVAQRVDCGPHYDEVVADAQDVVAGDCERSKGEGTLGEAQHGEVLARARPYSGRLPMYHGNSGQAAYFRVRCPAAAGDGCGGTLEAAFARPPRLAFGAIGYWVPGGRTTEVGVVLGVDAGAFHADSEGRLRRRWWGDLRRSGRIPMRVVAAHGFGAHRTQRTFRATVVQPRR
ncbi:MAG: hypothetical protein HZB46_08525 [Solirubrobacterales bacterium]|nr:hypothetical protein [Solirubrobacterales bacterium]